MLVNLIQIGQLTTISEEGDPMERSLVEEALIELQNAQANTKETGFSSPFLLTEPGLKEAETLRTDTKK
jgi:hypothetical protein